ncbi:MAG: leucine-rich repeat domain-containing protein [Acetatifactor sp.]|nr:leucine-rich repeat domain-containing protein [Acetatifactor sp.]
MSGKEYEYDAGGYCLKYRIEPEGICISGCRGNAWTVSVPSQIEGRTVTAIDKKAFLSRKKLRRIDLPEGLRSIGDWAFAYCGSLEHVTIPAGCSHMGKSLFLDCVHLDCVSGIRCGEDGHDGMPEAWTTKSGRLLAAAVTQLEAYYLLEPALVGSREWLGKWDVRLEAVMRTRDQEGYSRQVLCGEEDYGSTDLNAFLQAKRQKKVKLAMLRLLCDEELAGGLREYLEGYLVSHTKGCESEESWQVVLEEGETRSDYVQLFLELGCATRDNIEAMVAEMREDQPQLRAAFLRYRQERLEYGDFFAGLSL